MVTPVMVAPCAPTVVHTAGVWLVNTTGFPESPPVADKLAVLPTRTTGSVPQEMVCASKGADGTTAFDAAEAGPVPFALSDLTTNV